MAIESFMGLDGLVYVEIIHPHEVFPTMRIRCAVFRSNQGDYLSIYKVPEFGDPLKQAQHETDWVPVDGYQRVTEIIDVNFPELPQTVMASKKLERIAERENKAMKQLAELQLERAKVMSEELGVGGPTLVVEPAKDKPREDIAATIF